MTAPAVSICIPTYNRARYLRCLLGNIAENIGALKHSYEIVISDNASTDDTEKAVGEFAGKLNIRYIKRDKNYGGHDNWAHLKKQAQGAFQLYLADDDLLILPEVSAVVDRMLADPELGVVFAPWKLYDRVADKYMGNFYAMEQDAVIGKGEHEKLLLLVLSGHIFPEIYVIRSELARAASVFTHDLAYWAFVHIAEYISFGKILFRQEPFYTTVTRYFEGEGERGQFGHAEVQEGWDRYRSGLEYIMSRIPAAAMTQEKHVTYLLQIQKFMAMRLSVAIRLRIAGGRDAIDTYYLACRLKAMGYPQMLPLSFDAIRCLAAAQYLISGNAASDGIDKIVCICEVPPLLKQALDAKATLPVSHVTDFTPEKYPHAVVLAPGSLRGAAVDHAALARHHIRMVGIADLLQKFS